MLDCLYNEAKWKLYQNKNIHQQNGSYLLLSINCKFNHISMMLFIGHYCIKNCHNSLHKY